jgi:LmbE family N-acetylglucosaminyl deacetylase
VTVLAVFAHPDDEALACGGTLARLAGSGTEVIVLCASRGERGSLAGPVRDAALGDERARELFEAARALGVSGVILLDHPDGDLRWADVSALHADIVMAIRRYRPAAVITFGADGLYWHDDHIAVHERTTTAVASLGFMAPALYYVTMPRGVMRAIVGRAAARGWQPTPKGFWSLQPDAFGLHAATPTIIVNVEAWVPRKLDAIRRHRSQMGAAHPFDDIPEPESRQWLGVEHFHRSTLVGGDQQILELLATAPR